MAPYVAVMLPVLVGFALLALDGSRRMSLQTQMQAAADSLALAGARELNKQAGAEARAISAMANAHAATKSSNTLFGARIVADADLHVRLLFQSVRGERGDRRRCGERGFRREIRRCERSRRRRGQPSFRRRSWQVFQPTRSRSAPTRSPVLRERASVRSRRSSSATPMKPARDR